MQVDVQLLSLLVLIRDQLHVPANPPPRERAHITPEQKAVLAPNPSFPVYTFRTGDKWSLTGIEQFLRLSAHSHVTKPTELSRLN